MSRSLSDVKKSKAKGLIKKKSPRPKGDLIFDGLAVDAPTDQITPEAEPPSVEELLDELKSAFEVYDLERKGYIQADELCRLLKNLGQTLPSKELEKIIFSADANLNLKFSEVVAVIKPAKLTHYNRFAEEVKTNLDKEEYDKMVQSFQDLDKDGLGFIKTRDLMNAFKFFGQAKSDKDTANLTRKVDPFQKGMVTFDRYVVLMTEENRRRRLETLQKSFLDRRAVFAEEDKAQLGTVNLDDAKHALAKLDVHTTIDGIKLAMEFAGMDDKESIDYTEFNDIIDVIKSGFKSPEISEEQLEEIEDIFAIFDKESKGFLRMSDLVYALGCMKLSLNDTEVLELVALSGLDTECYVRMYRFKRLLETRLKDIDSTVEGNKLSREEIEDLKSVFLEFDADGDGIISIEELALIMQSLGKRYSRKKLQEIISSADEDGNGTLEFPEVVALMEKNMKKSRFLDEMRRAFHHFDHDDNGYISPEELRKALQRMGLKLGKLDFLRMLRKVDTDKDGQISFKEFIIMMISDVDI